MGKAAITGTARRVAGALGSTLEAGLAGARQAVSRAGDAVSGLVRPDPGGLDLNRASREELLALPGIGPARAERILSHRPYEAVDELVGKGVLPRSVLGRLEGRLRAG